MVKKKSDKGKVKVGKLNVNKETIKDLEGDEMQKIKGGVERGLSAGCRSVRVACPGETAAGMPGCGGKTSGKKCNP